MDRVFLLLVRKELFVCSFGSLSEKITLLLSPNKEALNDHLRASERLSGSSHMVMAGVNLESLMSRSKPITQPKIGMAGVCLDTLIAEQMSSVSVMSS